jgi:GntR family transcriptional regulator, transcriptional repressor for pyruvate dehydrogenase complex
VTFSPLATTPVYQQVADRVAEAILAGELPPGEPLPNERELSQQFGVSRSTIREALRALQARGLVVSSGSRTRPLRTVGLVEGATGPLREALVHLFRLRRVRLSDLVDVRCALEAAALERAAEDPDPLALRETRTALEDMQKNDISVEEFDEADVRFHLALVAASGNEAMHLVMLAVRDSIAHHLLEALRLVPEPPETFRILADQHATILKAVEAGDAAQSARLIRQHIVGFYRRFVPQDLDEAEGGVSQGG